MKTRLADIARAWLPRLLIIGLTVLLLVFGPNALNAPIPPDAIELDTAERVWTDPQDDYTRTLLAAFPRLTGERGVVHR